MSFASTSSLLVVLLLSASFVTVDGASYNVTITRSTTLDTILDPRNSIDHSTKKIFEQWTGGDCDVSVKLSDRYTAFLYGDTLIGTWLLNGKVRVKQPFSNKMPHSSLGIFDHRYKQRNRSSMSYHWGNDESGFLRLPGQQHNGPYFWPSVATPMRNNSFCVLGERVFNVKPTPTSGDFNFVTNGSFVVCLDGIFSGDGNSSKTATLNDPKNWRQRWSYVSGTGNLSLWNFNHSIEWRSAVRLEEGEDRYYIFGSVHRGSASGGFAQVLARIGVDDFFNFRWEQLEAFVTKPTTAGATASSENNSSNSSQWRKPAASVPVDDLQPMWSGPFTSVPEFTVDFSQKLGNRYLVLFIPPFSINVELRTSPTLWGPWDASTSGSPDTVWTLPNIDTNTTFCYAMKRHESLDKVTAASSSEKGKKVWSYVCNTNDIKTLFLPRYANVYIPRFVAVDGL